MTSEQIHTPIWTDFPEFYENEAIKKLAVNEMWTVSTTESPDPTKKNKMPIDMYALMHKQVVWGLAFNRGWHPLVDLKTLCDVLPSATNNAYYLDALRDKMVVLDIEPGCPGQLKNNFMQLPYLYAETSMSGKGLHLIFDLPEKILDGYPNARNKLSLQDGNGYYEILLNHMVTFTRNAIPRQEQLRSISEFENLFEMLAMKAIQPAESAQVLVENIQLEDIPHADEIIYALQQETYRKTLQDFEKKGTATGYDSSAYEFSMAGFYYRKLQQILLDEGYNDYPYSDEEKAVLVYEIISAKLPYRSKHDQTRNGMPWLLYIAATFIAKYG